MQMARPVADGVGDQFKDFRFGLKKVCKKAGIKGITWRAFRHTFASRLTRHGADLVTVKELRTTAPRSGR